MKNFSIILNKQKDLIKINELNFNEKDNVIKLKNFHYKNNKLLSFDKLSTINVFNPISWSETTVCEPMYPRPPVTKTIKYF